MSPLQAPRAFSLPTLPCQLKPSTSVTRVGGGVTVTVVQQGAGQELPQAEDLPCVGWENRGFAPVASGLGTPANPIHGEKVGLTPAMMEFTKPEKNNILKMQREKGKVEGGGIKSLGSLFVSVYKEANVDFSGKYLEHFKRNGKCLKRQTEQCPRQPSTWLGRCVEQAALSVLSWEDSQWGGGGSSQGP